MSSIPNSAMPRAVAPQRDARRTEGDVVSAVWKIAATPAIFTLGLSVMTLSAVVSFLSPDRSSDESLPDQVPV